MYTCVRACVRAQAVCNTPFLVIETQFQTVQLQSLVLTDE